jgi:hypothetical protein
MRHTVRFLVPLVALPLAFAACDKSKPTTDQTTPPPGDTAGAAPSSEGGEAPAGEPGAGEGGGDAAATEPGAPNVAWKDKTHKQRQEFMGIYVMPKMKDAFKSYDAKQFGTFKCETCHGKRMKEVNYHMPNTGIYPLNSADPVKGAMEYDEKMTKFMQDTVVPQMAELIGEPVGGKGKAGFFCMECHPAE